jgi:hypothetical protein
MRILFYKEDPTWFFEDNEIIKTQHPPEHYVLEARTRNDLAPNIHRVSETHSVNGEDSTEDNPFSDLKESQEFYRERRQRLISLGFSYERDSDPT